MSTSISAEERKRFVPKRRAPYLLQEEVIQNTPISKNSNSTNDKKEDNSLSKNIHFDKDAQNVQVVTTPNYHEETSKLYGLQKKIAYYLVTCCINSSSNTTGPITLETLSKVTQTTKQTTKKIINRMIEKKLFFRTGGKCGKGGFSVFHLEQGFIDVVRLHLQLENNYSSNNNFSTKRDTSETNENNVLPEEWKKINFDAISEIGFGVPQIKILYNKNNTTPEVVQTSINHFAFALKNKPDKLNKYQSKLAVFMSTLSKGGTWVESDYVSPQEMAFNQLAAQRISKIEMIKQKEEKLLSSEFTLWETYLTEEQRNEILSEEARKTGALRGLRTSELKSYFQENIWPKKMPPELVSLKEELGI